MGQNEGRKFALTLILVLFYSRLLQAGTQDLHKMVENLETQMEDMIDTIEEESDSAKRDANEHRNQIMQKLKRQQSSIAHIRSMLEKQEKVLETQDKKINIIYQQSTEIGRMIIGLVGQQSSQNLVLDVIRSNPNLNPLSRVAAIPWPSSGAFVVSHGPGMDKVIHMDGNGEIVSFPYTNYHEFNPSRGVSGLVLTEGQLNILHKNGTIVRVLLQDTSADNGTFSVEVGELQHTGSMGAEFVSNHKDFLLLTDKKKGEVFTYDLVKKVKTVHLTGLDEPVSVTYTNSRYETAYIVCEEGAGVVKTYNASWHHLKTIRSNQEEFLPRAVLMSPRGTVLVADAANTVVSEFNIRGRFLRNVLDKQDGIDQPRSMSYSQGRLWLACNADTYSNVKSYIVH